MLFIKLLEDDEFRCARADWYSMIDALIAEGTGKLARKRARGRRARRN